MCIRDSYFTVDIDLREQSKLKLLPGMSVRVTAPSGQGAKPR